LLNKRNNCRYIQLSKLLFEQSPHLILY
jgi:hypothetical protein